MTCGQLSLGSKLAIIKGQGLIFVDVEVPVHRSHS